MEAFNYEWVCNVKNLWQNITKYKLLKHEYNNVSASLRGDLFAKLMRIAVAFALWNLLLFLS